MSVLPFSFGFHNEDIDEAAEETNQDTLMGERHPACGPNIQEVPAATDFEPRWHTINAMLNTLPSRISYTSIKLPPCDDSLIFQSSVAIPGKDDVSMHLPRRDFFDIKVQQMAEGRETFDAPLNKLVGLSTSDIMPNSYEGGFKTWECSVDLAAYVAASLIDRSVIKGEHHIVEVGAGSALPISTWLYFLLKHSTPTWTVIHLTIADFNQSVLELATTPNILLTWYFARAEVAPPLEGDLDITPDLLNRFTRDLSAFRINISFLSGSWGSAFSHCLNNIVKSSIKPKSQTEILASETIYSPDSIHAFTEVLVNALRNAASYGGCAKAFVAAKRFYFGVGGGVDEFIQGAREFGCDVGEVWKREPPGIATVILDVVRKEGLGCPSEGNV
ncbi:hypothetical protein N7G274_010393 [Stereocaulon virgatum]|uniref:protein-histidine N-methyltransferase n=1 Tax=Stereocaulon virgatum TaxID=373712 RepID=A0ABR3ZUQ1_9LECA